MNELIQRPSPEVLGLGEKLYIKIHQVTERLVKENGYTTVSELKSNRPDLMKAAQLELAQEPGLEPIHNTEEGTRLVLWTTFTEEGARWMAEVIRKAEEQYP